MNPKNDPERASTPAAERRQHVRVKLTARIVGRPLGVEESFLVEEASVGGFSIRSTTRFVPDSEYRFRLENESGQSTIIETMCRYCNTVGEGDGPLRRHHAGFQFLPQATRRLRLILGAIAIDAP